MVVDHPLEQGHKRSVLSLSSNPGHFLFKKQRLDAATSTTDDFSNCLSSIVHDPALSISPCSTETFTFGGMVTGFDSEPDQCITVPDNGHPILDSLLLDLPGTTDSTPCKFDISKESSNSRVKLPTECLKAASSQVDLTSPVSSSTIMLQSSNVPVLSTAPSARVSVSQSLPISTSPVSSTPSRTIDSSTMKKDDQIPGDTTDLDQFHEKRMADRAARNRESSRRAREKAKQRLRALETHNRSLLDMVQHIRLQNEQLYSQLQRARAIQQNCMCSFNTPPVINTTAVSSVAAVTATGRSQPTTSTTTMGMMQLDRCGEEKSDAQMRLDPTFTGSV